MGIASAFYILLLLGGSVKAETFDLPAAQVDDRKPLRIYATRYYVYVTDEQPGGISLVDKNNRPISPPIPLADYCKGAIEGTFLIRNRNGEAVTYNFADSSGRRHMECKPWLGFRRAFSQTRSRYSRARGPMGDGVYPYILVPYRSIAVDRNVFALGSVVYVPSARGQRVLTGEGSSIVHDGYFYAVDVGSDIRGRHIDVFTGTDRSDTLPGLITSSPEHRVDMYLVDDPVIAERLRLMHLVAQQPEPSRSIATNQVPEAERLLLQPAASTVAGSMDSRDANVFRTWRDSGGNAKAADELLAYLGERGLADVVPPHELFRNASDWNSVACRGASPFDVPPSEYWPHLAKTLALFRHLKQRQLLPPGEVTSVYRNKRLNRCAGGTRRSRHLVASAIDLAPFPGERGDPMEAICNFWKKEGRNWNMGLSLYPSGRIHVDTAGYRTWGADHRRRSAICI